MYIRFLCIYFLGYLNRCNSPEKERPPNRVVFSFSLACRASPDLLPGYETDERSSLGERGDRCQWQIKEAERVAAVGVQRRRAVAEAHTGHRNRDRTNLMHIQLQTQISNRVLPPQPYRVFITDLTVVDTRFFIHAFYIEEIVGLGAFLLICCIYQIYLL